MPTFIDIGSYTGDEIEGALENGFEVHAFEPNPNLKDLLMEKFGNNHHVKLNFTAAWDKDGSAKFYGKYMDWETEMGRSLIEEKTNVSKQDFVEVSTTNIGRYLKELDQDIEVLKIDAEGAEYHIIESVINDFDYRRVKNWFVEDHKKYIESNSWEEHKEKVLDQCKKLGINLKDWTNINGLIELLGQGL